MTIRDIDLPEISGWLGRAEREGCAEQVKLANNVRKAFSDEPIEVDRPRLQTMLGYQRLFPYDLWDWELFLHTLWLCTYDRRTSLPRWPEILALLGRGSGKNGFISFEAFCLTSKANGIRRYNVDICAMTESQAKTSFLDVKDDVLEPNQPDTRLSYRWTDTYIRNKTTQSMLRYWTNNPKTKDSYRPGCVIFDEVHAYQNYANINVFTTGLGKVDDPRVAYISSDGEVRGGVLDDMKEIAEAVLDGEEPDLGTLHFICKLDDPREVHDEAMWQKAVPSLPYRPQLMAEMRREYAKWKRDPSKATSFMTKRMNLPGTRADVQVADWETLSKATREIPDMRGRPCVVGVDFARTTDMMSACALWRDGDMWYARQRSWWCTRSSDADRVKAPVDKWDSVTVVDESEMDIRSIADWIGDLMLECPVEMIAVDDYRYTIVRRELEGIGYSVEDGSVKKVRPSDIIKAQPVIDAALAGGRIAWGEDPCMRWCANNVKLVPVKGTFVTEGENFRYGKIEPHGRKTDAFMAMVAAFCVADAIEELDTALEFLDPITF